MLKKFIVIGVLGAAGVAAVAGTGAMSYVRTGVHSAHQSVRDSVPVEWEIKRARQMITELDPEITRNMRSIKLSEIEVRKLAEQIEDKNEFLVQSRSEIKRLSGDLETGSVRFVYLKRSFSAAQVKEDLDRRFKQYKAHEATTDKLQQILAAREIGLDAAKEKLDGMLLAKRELEVSIEDLQARLKLVEVAETSSYCTFDDSALSQTQKLLEEISTKIEVKEEMLAGKALLSGHIQLEEETSPELLDEIADYFGSDTEAEVKVMLSSHEL